LNELITNALKHAFPNERRGTVRVELYMVGDREATLSVSDDGIGIPDGFDPEKSISLGMQLVSTLVEQLEGQLEIVRQLGTTFRVRFPLEV
jgi:two-component sensor histidine kinase